MDFFSFPMFLRDERKLTFHSDQTHWLVMTLSWIGQQGALLSSRCWTACRYFQAAVFSGSLCSVNTKQTEPCLLTHTFLLVCLFDLFFFFFNKYDVIVFIPWCDAASHHSNCYCCNSSRIMCWYWFHALLTSFGSALTVLILRPWYLCFITRRTWFSAQCPTRSRSAPRTWTALWARPPEPSRRPPKR